MTLNRRQFLGYLGAGAALSTLPVLRARAANPHVVVVGGGFGGATCAKYLRRYDSTIDITLIEPSTQYITCPGSNWVLGGLRDLERLTQNYTGLTAHNVKHVVARVERIDAGQRRVRLDNGDELTYDRSGGGAGHRLPLGQHRRLRRAGRGADSACVQGRAADDAAAQTARGHDGWRYRDSVRAGRSLPLSAGAV